MNRARGVSNRMKRSHTGRFLFRHPLAEARRPAGVTWSPRHTSVDVAVVTLIGHEGSRIKTGQQDNFRFSGQFMGQALLFVFALLLTDIASPQERTSGWPDVVSARTTEAGVYLTDGKGMTLYLFERDHILGHSACYDECALSWPPVPIHSDPEDEEWSIIDRTDGTSQLAWRGKPLYKSLKDTHPGSMLGADAAAIWKPAFAAIDLPAGFTLQQTLAGRVLADAKGITLYWRDSGLTPQVEQREDIYSTLWLPYTAPLLATASKPWSIVARSDTTRQWAYSGRPLYRFEKDQNPGETKGDGFENEWIVAALEPPPPKPDWVTFQVIDTGIAVANSQGLTLYSARNMEQVKSEKTCLDDCMATYMQPVLVKSGEKPVGNWSIVRNDAGALQWAFNGALLFTHARDSKPGDSKGAGFAVGQGIGGGFRPVMQVALLTPR